MISGSVLVATMLALLGSFVTYIAVSLAYKECPRFEAPELNSSNCFTKAFVKPFRSSNPKTMCVEISLKCFLLKTQHSNSTLLTFKCSNENSPNPQFIFQRSSANATWLKKLTSAEIARIRICLVPDDERRELQCSLYGDVNEEAIRRGFFHFEINFKWMNIRTVVFQQSRDTIFSCNCSLYERFFHDQWELCNLSVDHPEINYESHTVILGEVAVGIVVTYVAVYIYQLFRKMCCGKN